MDNPVMIFGATALGRQARLIFEENGNTVYGFLDDDKSRHGAEIDGVSILGAMDDDGFLKFIGRKCEAFVAVDDNTLRKSLVRMLHEKRHVQPVNCIHKTAIIPDVASIGHGNLIDMGVMMGAGASLGSHCLVHAGAVVAPEASLGDFVQVGLGARINSNVTIEDEVFIGSGAVLVAGITIGKGARIGAGSIVIQPVAAGETVFGNPAEVVKA
ncbi:MAG TPA: NeuD/PglB/VioB family sugar acetyltransferase [Cyclobacteriaceae bacterium]